MAISVYELFTIGIGPDTTPQPYPFTTGAELLRFCTEHDLSTSDLNDGKRKGLAIGIRRS